MPDAQTAINALAGGEIDYIDEPQVDLLKLFDGNKDVVVKNNNKFGLQVIARCSRFTELMPLARWSSAAS
jgi:peptide/nickel transport system substrate-binding protein